MVALGSGHHAKPLGLSLFRRRHDQTVTFRINGDRLLKEGVNPLLGSVLEMRRTEDRRSGDNHHVHAGVYHLLVGLEACEAVIFRNFLAPLVLQAVTEAAEAVSEHIAQSRHLDPVGGIQQILNGSASTAAATDHADLKFLSVDGLVRKFRNIILARLSEGCHLAGFITTCAGGQQDTAAYQTYTDLGALAKKGSSVHFVAHFIDSLYVI